MSERGIGKFTFVKRKHAKTGLALGDWKCFGGSWKSFLKKVLLKCQIFGRKLTVTPKERYENRQQNEETLTYAKQWERWAEKKGTKDAQRKGKLLNLMIMGRSLCDILKQRNNLRTKKTVKVEVPTIYKSII